MTPATKHCLNCGRTIKGRADKKFCDDSCRNSYNNQVKSETGTVTIVRNINHYLGKNRRILKQFLPDHEEMTKVHHDKLTLEGFQFKFHTHSYINKKGQTYFFCYEYGYLPLDKGWYLLVRRDEL